MILFCMKNKMNNAIIELFAKNRDEAKKKLAEVMCLHEGNIDRDYDVSFATENHQAGVSQEK
ncbi:hypothetical protein [Sulfuricurvum sp.]|uniref:hypothetical protein n=1 Tax=Sulfuricurvum sp. TaxID=2025608 RepID=UPI003567EBBD